MSEVNALTDFVNNIDSDVDVMWGLYRIPGLENKVKITILASGFDVTVDDKERPLIDTAKIQKEAEDTKRIEEEYGPGVIDNFPKRPIGSRTKVLNPDELDNDDAIAEAERPSYTRNFRSSASASFGTNSRNSLSTDKDANRAPSTSNSNFISFDDLEQN
jgi:cell division protein FtsZ